MNFTCIDRLLLQRNNLFDASNVANRQSFGRFEFISRHELSSSWMQYLTHARRDMDDLENMDSKASYLCSNITHSAQNTTRIRTIIPRSTESAKSDQHWISYVFHISLDQEVSKHASKQQKFYSSPKRYNKIARFEKKPYTSNQHET
jgi:hypothetical protein